MLSVYSYSSACLHASVKEARPSAPSVVPPDLCPLLPSVRATAAPSFNSLLLPATGYSRRSGPVHVDHPEPNINEVATGCHRTQILIEVSLLVALDFAVAWHFSSRCKTPGLYLVSYSSVHKVDVSLL